MKSLEQQIIEYLLHFEIIDKRQFAFEKGKAANKAFGDFSDFIKTNLNNKLHIAAVFIDMKKAFDMSSHKILLKSPCRG